MEAWMSRGQDGRLMLHSVKPSVGYNDVSRSWYYGCCGYDIEIPEEWYPELTFENSPRRIELKIKINK